MICTKILFNNYSFNPDVCQHYHLIDLSNKLQDLEQKQLRMSTYNSFAVWKSKV